MSAQTSGSTARRRSGFRPAGGLPRQPRARPARLPSPRHSTAAGGRRDRSPAQAAELVRDAPPRRPAPLGRAGLTELLDDPPQLVEPAAAQTGDHRPIQAVKELPPASAFDQKGDELPCRSVVKYLHHAPEYARRVPGDSVLKKHGLRLPVRFRAGRACPTAGPSASRNPCAGAQPKQRHFPQRSRRKARFGAGPFRAFEALSTMFQILEARFLAPDVKLLRIEAPRIARKRQAGQFVILRVHDHGERIPITIADSNPERGDITIVVQGIGKTTQAAQLPRRGRRHPRRRRPARQAVGGRALRHRLRDRRRRRRGDRLPDRGGPEAGRQPGDLDPRRPHAGAGRPRGRAARRRATPST